MVELTAILDLWTFKSSWTPGLKAYEVKSGENFVVTFNKIVSGKRI